MQCQSCVSAAAVSHSRENAADSPPTNADAAGPTGRLTLATSPRQQASIAMLPDDVVLLIVDHLDFPSRRALGGADRHARAVLMPLRRFDRLHAAIRWSDSTGRLTELLGRVAGEPAPQRGTLLCSVVERILRFASISRSLSVQLIEQIESLPAAERARPLAALATVLARQHPRDHELERRMLGLAEQLPQGMRGEVLGQCLMSFCPPTTPAGFQQWMAGADALPPEGASRLLEAVVHLAAWQQQLSEALAASVLERVRALRTSDGVPASCQGRVLKKLVDELDSVVEVGLGVKSRLAVWDAILDTARAALRSGHWPLLVAVALHRWLGGWNVPPNECSRRTVRLTELYAGFKAEALLAAAGNEAGPVMRALWSDRQSISIHRRFAQAAELDAPTQATLYAEYSHLFVAMPGVERDDYLERELFHMGLQRINALNPPSLRVEPLMKWGDALQVSESAALWMAFADAVDALPVEHRATVLMRAISSSHSRIGFSVLLKQTAVLPPALGGPLLGGLAFRVMGQPADEQGRRAQALIELAATWPPLACTDLVVNAMSAMGLLKEDASLLLQRFATDIVARLPLARRAGVLAQIAAHRSPVAKRWVLDRLPALADDQQRLAVPGEPMLAYRAEIVRTMIVALGGRDIPTETQFGMLWPSLRQALDGLEPEARGSAVAALPRILTRLPAALRDEVEQALATRWSVERPAQPQLPAGAQGS